MVRPWMYLEVQPTEFADELDVTNGRSRGAKDDSELRPLSSWKDDAAVRSRDTMLINNTASESPLSNKERIHRNPRA